MPSAWSEKDERQHEEVRSSAISRGRSPERAKEIAARVVNKHRRLLGRTPNTATQGTGNPNKPLEERSRRELYNRSKQLNISGRSAMNKKELVEAIRKHS